MKTTRKVGMIVSIVACVLAGGVFLVVRHPQASHKSRRGQMTTDTRSSTFPDDHSKIVFLKKYLKLPSEVEAAEYHIRYQDNSGGVVPGPSDWDMQVVLKDKPDSLPLWTDGLTQIDHADLSWGYGLLPSEKRWAIESTPAVYERGQKVVAVFYSEGIIFTRVQAH
jgi:hypothetical protein